MIEEQFISSLLGLVCFSVALLVAARLLRRADAHPSSLNLLVRVAAWSLIGAVVVVGGLLGMAIVGGILAWIATIVVLAMIFNRLRLARQDALLAVMATSVDRGMPLLPVLVGLSDEFSGLSRRRMRRLLDLLVQGIWLPDALERVPNLLPPQALIATRVGCATNRLGQALRDAAAARARRAPLWNLVAGRLGIAIWTLVAMATLGSFWWMFIWPRYLRIFSDFDLNSLPPATAFLERFPLWLSSPLVVMGVGGGVILSFYLLLVYIGWLPFVFSFGPLAREFEEGPLFRNLALIAESGESMHRGLTVLGQAHPNGGYRRRLSHAARLLEEGTPLGSALAEARLVGRTQAELVRSAQHVGNLPWSLRAIGESADRRLLYRLQAFAELFVPAIVVMIGLLVGVLAVACIAPLAALIWKML